MSKKSYQSIVESIYHYFINQNQFIELMNLFKIFKKGRQYAKIWPLEAKLGAIFPENRVIKTVRFSEKLMPLLAACIILWQRLLGPNDLSIIASTTLTALFALAIPLQGWWWLGNRANQKLKDGTLKGYWVIYHQLEAENVTLSHTDETPDFYALGLLLKKAKKHLTNNFWEEL